MEDGLIKVVTPIDDTPASKAGLLANDVITQIDEDQVQGLTLNQAVDKMRGPVNSNVKLKISRKEAKDPIEVTLTRDVIKIRPVRSRVEGAAPRVATVSYPRSSEPHDYHPGRITLERRLDDATAGALAAKGHTPGWWEDWDYRAGAVCLISADRGRGIMEGGSDPRRPTGVAGI